jgi:hypothetical protein
VTFFHVFIRGQTPGHRIETNRRSISWFSYDLGVTIIRHQNIDSMFLASALMRGIHHLIIFKMADVQGAMHPHKRTDLGHGVSILMTNHGVAGLRFFG